LPCEVARKVQDKRLGIELSSEELVRSITQYHPAGDEIEFELINTGRQLADCLTKSMKPDFLVRVLAEGYINVKKLN